jgi:prepilin-type processing-associated H-X9-DG protein
MNPKPSHRRAFTRLEAVAICGVALFSGATLLPAIAQGDIFGVFARARENARRSSCQSNLKQVGLGVLQYTQDYDEKYPPAATKTPGQTGYGWAGVIQPYIKTTLIYQCPSETHPAQLTSDVTKPGYTDYWLNSRASGSALAIFEAPAQTLIMGDGDGGSPNSTARYNISALPYSWRTNPRSPAQRHLGFGNYAFADGHVKSLRPPAITMAPLAQMSKYGASTTFSPH